MKFKKIKYKPPKRHNSHLFYFFTIKMELNADLISSNTHSHHITKRLLLSQEDFSHYSLPKTTLLTFVNRRKSDF